MSLRTLLLSDNRAQQTRLTVWAVGTVTAVFYSAIQIVEVHFGLMKERDSNGLIIAMMVSACFFYAVTRSGLNLRFHADPSLTMVQLLVATGFSVWSYLITGPARGVIVGTQLGCLIYGVFALSPRRAWFLCLFTCLTLGATMFYCAYTSPATHPPEIELVHFLFMAVVCCNATTLSGHLSLMRQKMTQQAKELKLALEKLKLLATRDELTQIHNRRHMTELMGIELRQHERSGSPLCLALLDIDFFKNVNDNFGHSAGDQVLQGFARVALQALRTSDLLARWGGEEFLVMFPGTTPEQAMVALQRLHDQLRSTAFDGLPADYRATFSAGLTQCRSGEAIETATERADQAMYQAKTGGRNRTELV